MVYRRLFAIISFATMLIVSGHAFAEKRLALVIGNSEYEHSGRLKNPVNDAKLMTSSLTAAGFEVTTVLDADLRTMRRAILDFGRALRNKTEAGLFYYAGHGVQVRGENFLIPVSAKITDEDEIELEAINVNSFLRVMRASASNVNIVVLDACRDNPFARSFRSSSRGLAPVDAPKGTYIAYATSPGDVAADGNGVNSPYTQALARSIAVKGIAIEQVFKRARRSVLDTTNNKQVPWETSSITGDFYFHSRKVVVEPAKPVKPTKPVQTVKPATPKQDDPATIYAMIINSKSPGVLRTFAKQFPDSFYAKLALARVEELDGRVTETKPQKPAEAAKINPADKAWLGVNIQVVTDEIAKKHHLSKTRGVLVNNVVAGSPAESATIIPNDIIVKFDGQDIKELRDLLKLIRGTPAGKQVSIMIMRTGAIRTLRATLHSLNDRERKAAEAWKLIEDSKNQLALDTFIKRYDGTQTASLALTRLNELKSPVDSKKKEASEKWRKLQYSPSQYELQNFIRKFGGTSEARLAATRITLVMNAKSVWNSTTKHSKRESDLEQFNKKYSGTHEARLAMLRLGELKSGQRAAKTKLETARSLVAERKKNRKFPKVGKEPKKIAVLGRWGIYHRNLDGGHECYAGTGPTNSKTKRLRAVWLSNILFAINRDRRHEIQIEFKNAVVSAKLIVDGVQFQMSNRGDPKVFFVNTGLNNLNPVELLKAKRTGIVRTVIKGKTREDKFSLNGVTASLKSIDRHCPVIQ